MFADVIAVVAAVGEGGAAVAALDAATVFSAITEVGVCLNVAGAVTGSKNLQKVGGVMAMAGGVGSLVDGGISALSTTATTDTSTVDTLQGANGAMADASSGTAIAPDATVPTVAPTPTPLSAVSNSAPVVPTEPPPISPDLAGQTGSTPINSSANIGSSAPNSGIENPSANLNVQAQAAPVGSSNLNVGASTPTSGYENAGTSFNTATTATPTGAQIGNVSSAAQPGSISEWFSSLKPGTQTAVVQGGMGAIGGLSNAYTSAKQLDLQKKQFAFQQQQYANMGAQPTYVAPVAGTGLLQQPSKSNT